MGMLRVRVWNNRVRMLKVGEVVDVDVSLFSLFVPCIVAHVWVELGFTHWYS